MVTVLPLIVEALGTGSKNPEKSLDGMAIKGRIKDYPEYNAAKIG